MQRGESLLPGCAEAARSMQLTAGEATGGVALCGKGPVHLG